MLVVLTLYRNIQKLKFECKVHFDRFKNLMSSLLHQRIARRSLVLLVRYNIRAFLFSGVNFQSAVPRFKAERTADPKRPEMTTVTVSIDDLIKEKKLALKRKQKRSANKHPTASPQKQKEIKNCQKTLKNVSKRKTKMPESLQFQRFRKLLKNIMKVKNATKTSPKNQNMKKNSKEIVSGKSPHHIVNCSYEKGESYVTTHEGKFYTCQMTYLVTHVMRCVTVKTKQNSEPKGAGFDSQYAQQCLVEKKRQVHSWRCSRRISATQWYSFSFKRINSSMTSIKNMTSYAGMSFVCTRTQRKNQDHVIK